MLDPGSSRVRQGRLLAALQRRELDAVVIGWTPHVYYLTAHRPFWQHAAGLVLKADGRSWLATANAIDTTAAADECVSYVANKFSTLREEQPAVIAEAILRQLRDSGAKRIGIDASAVTSQVAAGFDGNVIPIDEELWQLRRQKDADELGLMKTAIACTEAMYRRAREIIEPGIPELRVFSELHAAAVQVAGEPLSDLLGNDFACGVPGGPARGSVVAKAGQLYLLDLGPAYRGYFSDNCRAIAVDRRPTDAQLRACEAVVGVFPIIERMARPGVRCHHILAAVDDHLRAAWGRPMGHHLGHGVGLQPHEFPHLNPEWDDALLEGEVFTCEPGIYEPQLQAGIRIENQYLVTANGVENLTPFPMGLM